MDETVKTFDVDVDGIIRTIYDDSLTKMVPDMSGEMVMVCRLSNVEWEESQNAKGWSVRAAHHKDLAIRIQRLPDPNIRGKYTNTLVCSDDTNLEIYLFAERDKAIETEKKFYSQFLPPREINANHSV